MWLLHIVEPLRFDNILIKETNEWLNEWPPGKFNDVILYSKRQLKPFARTVPTVRFNNFQHQGKKQNLLSHITFRTTAKC